VSDSGLVGPTAPAAAPDSDRDDNQSPAAKYLNDGDDYPSSRLTTATAVTTMTTGEGVIHLPAVSDDGLGEGSR